MNPVSRDSTRAAVQFPIDGHEGENRTMSLQDRLRWKEWADSLRQTMMAQLTGHVTKSVDEIRKETATDKSASVLGTQRFWKACQAGTGTNNTLSKAGFELEFEPNAEGKIETVTFQLNKTWKAIMKRASDRRTAEGSI